MKKIIYLFAALTLIMSAASCNNDKKQAEIDQKQEQIDNLNRFIDIVGVYMDSINTQEQNLFVGKDGMKLSRKEEILANLRHRLPTRAPPLAVLAGRTRAGRAPATALSSDV